MVSTKKYKPVKRAWTFIKRQVRAIFLPTFDELHYIAALTIGLLILLLFYSPAVWRLVTEAVENPMPFVFFFIILAPVVTWLSWQVFKPHKIDDGDGVKIFFCVIYYGLFAIAGRMALSELSDRWPTYNDSNFVIFNWLLAGLISYLYVIRGFIAMMVLLFEAKTGYDKPSIFVGRSFKGDQYRLASLLVIMAISVVMLFWLRFYYSEPFTLAFLSYGYSLGIYKALARLVPGKMQSIPASSSK